MRHPITLLIVLAASLLAGCRSYPKAAPVEVRVEAVSPENAAALRAAYAQKYPNSQLGVIAAVLDHANGRFVAVGGVDVSRLAVGQVATFMNAKQKPLATGVIVTILPDSVHVRVDDPLLGALEPSIGDLMVTGID